MTARRHWLRPPTGRTGRFHAGCQYGCHTATVRGLSRPHDRLLAEDDSPVDPVLIACNPVEVANTAGDLAGREPVGRGPAEDGPAAVNLPPEEVPAFRARLADISAGAIRAEVSGRTVDEVPV